jgi:hypothetical protein
LVGGCFIVMSDIVRESLLASRFLHSNLAVSCLMHTSEPLLAAFCLTTLDVRPAITRQLLHALPTGAASLPDRAGDARQRLFDPELRLPDNRASLVTSLSSSASVSFSLDEPSVPELFVLCDALQALGDHTQALDIHRCKRSEWTESDFHSEISLTTGMDWILKSLRFCTALRVLQYVPQLTDCSGDCLSTCFLILHPNLSS